MSFPSYSPDLAPCDYYTLGPFKAAIRGLWFTFDEVKARAQTWTREAAEADKRTIQELRRPKRGICKEASDIADMLICLQLPVLVAFTFLNLLLQLEKSDEARKELFQGLLFCFCLFQIPPPCLGVEARLGRSRSSSLQAEEKLTGRAPPRTH